MRKTIAAIIALFLFIFVFTSGLIEPIINVLIWLITLNFNSPDISIFGLLVAKYGTWIITYSLVGELFRRLGWFDSSAMKIVYFIVSTIISFLLSWVIMVFENYLWIIAIVVGCLLLIVIGIFVTLLILSRKKAKEGVDNA